MTRKQIESLNANGIITVWDVMNRLEKTLQDHERWFLLSVILREMALAQKFDMDRKLTLPEE